MNGNFDSLQEMWKFFEAKKLHKTKKILSNPLAASTASQLNKLAQKTIYDMNRTITLSEDSICKNQTITFGYTLILARHAKKKNNCIFSVPGVQKVRIFFQLDREKTRSGIQINVVRRLLHQQALHLNKRCIFTIMAKKKVKKIRSHIIFKNLGFLAFCFHIKIVRLEIYKKFGHRFHRANAFCVFIFLILSSCDLFF